MAVQNKQVPYGRFPGKLIALRKQRGMTQKELAEHLDVTIMSVSKWERGVVMPHISSLLRMAKLFDIPLSDLIGTISKTNRLRQESNVRKRKKKNTNVPFT